MTMLYECRFCFSHRCQTRDADLLDELDVGITDIGLAINILGTAPFTPLPFRR
jgi:hypothetical protein